MGCERLAGLLAFSFSYLETRTIRKKLLRCRGPTSSRRRVTGRGQAHQRRRPRRRLSGPQRLWLPRLLGPALLPPRPPPPPRGAAGAAGGASIARARAPGCGSPLLPLALRGRARRLRSWRLRLEELLASRSTQKSLVSSPHLPLQAPRDGCRVAVGVAGEEGWDRLFTSPPPSYRPPLPPPHVPRTGTPGGEGECSFPRLGGWGLGKREEGAAGAAGTGRARTAGPARRGRKTACSTGPCAPRRWPLRWGCSDAGSGSQVPGAAGWRGTCSRAPGKVAHLQAPWGSRCSCALFIFPSERPLIHVGLGFSCCRVGGVW